MIKFTNINRYTLNMTKLSNTLENKAKFFAQYWGQKVFKETKFHNSPLCNINSTFIDSAKDWHLELKPLSNISDEDAIEVAKILHEVEGNFEIVYNADDLTSVSAFGRLCYSDTIDIFWNGNLRYDIASSIQILNAYDYLHSKGYALPWMNLEVQDLIDYGWVTLI